MDRVGEDHRRLAAMMIAFDILLVSTSAVQDAPSHLFDDRAQLPVDERVPLLPDLDLRIDRVDRDLANQVMDECEPKGMGRGHRQWGCTWGFFRDNPPMKSSSQPFAWDPDQAIYSAVALSRLVQTNTIGTEYAARVMPEDSGGYEIHPGPVTGQTADAWAHESIRKRWLTKVDAEGLAVLLAAYWPIRNALPRRLRSALWNHEFVAQTRDPNVRLVLVASALEALVHTDRYKSTAQFGRVAQLAAELGVPFTTADADEAYDLRSHVAHGDRLVSLLDQSEEPKQRFAHEQRMNALLLAVEEILRKAIRRGIEDRTFRTVFEDSARIRARWPI